MLFLNIKVLLIVMFEFITVSPVDSESVMVTLLINALLEFDMEFLLPIITVSHSFFNDAISYANVTAVMYCKKCW